MLGVRMSLQPCRLLNLAGSPPLSCSPRSRRPRTPVPKWLYVPLHSPFTVFAGSSPGWGAALVGFHQCSCSPSGRFRLGSRHGREGLMLTQHLSATAGGAGGRPPACCHALCPCRPGYGVRAAGLGFSSCLLASCWLPGQPEVGSGAGGRCGESSSNGKEALLKAIPVL